MAYGDFSSQITSRGALAVKRSRETSSTSFEYQKQIWTCTFKNQAAMTSDLADGCEMNYCLAQYCEKAAAAAEVPEEKSRAD